MHITLKTSNTSLTDHTSPFERNPRNGPRRANLSALTLTAITALAACAPPGPSSNGDETSSSADISTKLPTEDSERSTPEEFAASVQSDYEAELGR